MVARLRALVRAITAEVDDEGRAAYARAATAVTLAAYWHAVVGPSTASVRNGPRLAPCTIGGDVAVEPGAAEALAAFGASLAGEPTPLAGYAVGTLYTRLLPDATRSAFGAFFTPPPLVDRLLDLAEEAGADWARHAVLDPAAGGGAFIVPAAVRIASRLRAVGTEPRVLLATVNRRVRGFEVDPFSAWLTHVLLEISLWDDCVAAGTPGRPARLRPSVRVCDALDAPRAWDASADVVLGNPPFGKVTPAPSVRALYARSLYGHANLYGMFFDLAIRLTKPGGVVGFVSPASFFGGQYFTNLRALMRAEAPPRAVEFITDRSGVFEDVLQETVLITLRPGQAASPVRVSFNRVARAGGRASVEEAGTFPLPADPHAPWLLPRTPRDAAVLHRLAELPHRLADYGYRVSTGPLVWNRHRDQLTSRGHGLGVYPLLWAESVLPGGEFRFAAARRNHLPYVRVTPGQEHLVMREPCALVQRTTAKEQDRRLVAAVLPAEFLHAHGGVVIENHVNVVRNGAPAAAACAGAATLGAVAAFLNSAVADRVFRCISGSVAVSAYELAAVPLPGPAVMQALSAAVERGAPAAECERVLAAAYGLADADA